MPFNLKIILAFSVHNNTIVNTVQFKILNRKYRFSIQLHVIESNWIQLNLKKIFKIRIRIEKEFISILIHSRLLDNTYVYIIKQDNTQTDYIKKINIFLVNENGLKWNSVYFK